MSNGHQIFISYTQEDGDNAASLASELRDIGIVSYLAQRDLNVGDNWEPAIREALKESKVMLCMITPNSINSAWLHAEAGAAWVLNKPIVPALAYVKPEALIDILRLRQGLKFETPEQRRVLVAEIGKLLHANSFSSIPQSHDPGEKASIGEVFNARDNWDKLLRIGRWQRDEANELITGRGIHNYLLSCHHYAEPFRIDAVLRFSEMHAESRVDSVNAGIIFGWTTPLGVRRYFNIMLDEKRILLELIGNRGGDSYLDYQHLDKGIPFSLREGPTYLFRVEVHGRKMVASVRDGNSSWIYSSELPENPIGRVGLRPWRSRVECERFEVSLLTP